MIRHLADILQESRRPSAAAPLYVEMMEFYQNAPDTPCSSWPTPREASPATRKHSETENLP